MKVIYRTTTKPVIELYEDKICILDTFNTHCYEYKEIMRIYYLKFDQNNGVMMFFSIVFMALFGGSFTGAFSGNRAKELHIDLRYGKMSSEKMIQLDNVNPEEIEEVLFIVRRNITR